MPVNSINPIIMKYFATKVPHTCPYSSPSSSFYPEGNLNEQQEAELCSELVGTLGRVVEFDSESHFDEVMESLDKEYWDEMEKSGELKTSRDSSNKSSDILPKKRKRRRRATA
jgi:hypothetical protein